RFLRIGVSTRLRLQRRDHRFAQYPSRVSQGHVQRPRRHHHRRHQDRPRTTGRKRWRRRTWRHAALEKRRQAMSAFPGSPRILKGGIVLIDADSSAVLRLKGPPVETLKLEAEIDATDQLEFPEQNSGATSSGIFAQLAALE